MITIDRDTNGVPHISGRTKADVAFGFGYAQAEDHLHAMLRNYMEATGRLAEIEGEEALETDVRTRLWRTTEQSEIAYPKLDPSIQGYLDAFVSGVNRYMEANPDEVPPWANPVTPVEVIALYRLLHIRLNEWTMPELGLLLEGGLSNQFAVAPEKTAEGTTICAMDPHVPWVSIFRMYEAHLISEDGLNLYGAAPFGMPTIILGHTDHHAWSITINQCDISDMYIEQLNPEDHASYKYQDVWRPVNAWESTIRVKVEEGFREETHTLAWTHHGPIIGKNEDTAFTIRMSAYEIMDPISPLINIALADDLDAFKSALVTIDIPMFNIVYGDTGGNLYYLYNERCPARSTAHDWRKPVPGWIHQTEWQMYLPFYHLPQIENPVSGFLQNCNNAPWYVTSGIDMKQEDFPPYATFEETNGRASRMFAWIEEHGNITVEDAIDLIMDEYNITAETLKPLILKAYAEYSKALDDPDGHITQAISLLTAWDDISSAESVGMSVFTVWKIHYDQLLETQTDDLNADGQERLMVDALQVSTRYMIEHYGRIEIPWGEIHVLKRGHQEYPVGGASSGTEAIRPVRGRMNDEGKMITDFGSAFTMVVELGDPIRAWSLTPYGNSENPASPHYDDQITLWTERRLKRAWFSAEDIKANRSSKIVIHRR